MNFDLLLNQPEYDFLKNDSHLGDNIMLLTLGGSYAYGTNNENSDVDLRGVCYDPIEKLIGIEGFEQITETNTDTIIYGFGKMIKLLLNCNPNVIEQLGCKPEHYAKLNDDGRMLIDNVGIFLSQKAIKSFGHYAHNQLRRLQNAIARDRVAEVVKERHIKNSVQNQISSFNERYNDFSAGMLEVKILNDELVLNSNVKNYSLRSYLSMLSEMNECVRNYDKINHRNNKKDKDHLNKHAMHLLRLFITAIDIFTDKKINTYRVNELEALNKVRNGYYMNTDGTMNVEFFETVDALSQQFDYAVKNTELPLEPDYKRVQELTIDINLRFILRNKKRRIMLNDGN